MASNDAVGQATIDGQRVSAGAEAAIRRCVAELQPFADDARVEALVTKLQAIADPTHFVEVEKRDRLADELVKISKATMAVAGELTAADRVMNANATRDAQMRYLRSVSPAAAEATDRGRVA
jgi:hypothetical protein